MFKWAVFVWQYGVKAQYVYIYILICELPVVVQVYTTVTSCCDVLSHIIEYEYMYVTCAVEYA